MFSILKSIKPKYEAGHYYIGGFNILRDKIYDGTL